jgi:hypothetical protein
MSICVSVVDGAIQQTGIDPFTCNDLVLLSHAEYLSLNDSSLTELLKTFFEFDPVITGLVVSGSLLMFLVSHYSGNLVRWLGR